MKRSQKPKPYNVALDARNRAGGVHKDQKRRACPKQLRRDKSYKMEA